MRDVDNGWPAPGTKLHHSFGIWPLGKARVEITVQPDGDDSLVSIAEDVTEGPARLVPEPIRLAGMDVRNRESLRRLAYLAENRH
jgi:hypothetical protein